MNEMSEMSEMSENWAWPNALGRWIKKVWNTIWGKDHHIAKFYRKDSGLYDAVQKKMDGSEQSDSTDRIATGLRDYDVDQY